MESALFEDIELELNTNCNRKCWYCPNSYTSRTPPGNMEESLFSLIIRQLKELSYSGRLGFSFFGEPLLCRNLEAYIQMGRIALPNAQLVIFSNGDYLNLGMFKKLISLGVNLFIITQHIGAKSVFSEIYPSLPEKYKDKVIYRSYKEIRMHNRGGLIGDLHRDNMLSAPCYLPSEMMVVTAQGNVLPCCDDFNEINVMGNVKESSLIDIWTSSKFESFRTNLRNGQRHNYTPCVNCDHIS